MSEAQGCQRMIHLGLLVARSLLGTAVPADVLRRAGADAEARVLAKWVRKHLWEGAQTPPNSARQWVFYVRTRERWHDRIASCLRLMRVLSRGALKSDGFGIHWHQARSSNRLLTPWTAPGKIMTQDTHFAVSPR
jgi:hypothetical protein